MCLSVHCLCQQAMDCQMSFDKLALPQMALALHLSFHESKRQIGMSTIQREEEQILGAIDIHMLGAIDIHMPVGCLEKMQHTAASRAKRF